MPEGFNRSRVAEGLDRPTAMALAPNRRIFVSQQGGGLRVVEDGRLLARPFARFEVDSRGERGLLGVAVDPNFSRNHFVYVYFTTRSAPHHNRVVRLEARGNREVPGSRRLILRLGDLSAATNHNGGAIHFGGDGKLYVAVGDNAEGQNAQTLSSRKGKLLRINRDGSIPRSNPFFGRMSGDKPAIWALGLRNPFSFAVQRGTGRIFINDVGARTWEEINRGKAGANYGWPTFEGPESDARFTSPVFAYRHGNTASAITGGTFYNPLNRDFLPRFVGDYLFADFCGGWIRRYDLASDRALGFAAGISAPVDLQVGPNGTLFYLARGTGSLNAIKFNR